MVGFFNRHRLINFRYYFRRTSQYGRFLSLQQLTECNNISEELVSMVDNRFIQFYYHSITEISEELVSMVEQDKASRLDFFTIGFQKNQLVWQLTLGSQVRFRWWLISEELVSMVGHHYFHLSTYKQKNISEELVSMVVSLFCSPMLTLLTYYFRRTSQYGRRYSRHLSVNAGPIMKSKHGAPASFLFSITIMLSVQVRLQNNEEHEQPAIR